MMRAALYARVSTELQEKEQTIQSQLAAITHYAEAHGFVTSPALTYADEGFSGSQLERPALDELRDHAREGRFEAVVVLCPDRLARRYAYQVLLLEELRRAGIAVHFCERPISDAPDDQLLLQIQGAVAEYERAKILERARRGRLHRARLGELGPSRLPYGYRYAAKKHGGDGQIRVDEAEAALVRQVFDWYARERETLYGLLGKLNASAWRTRAGRKEWGATTVLRMLHCEWYVGRAYYNRTRSAPGPATAPGGKRPPKTILTERPRAEWITVPVPAILDEALFDRVQQRVQENRRFARRRLRGEEAFLLRGLLKCGICGHAYVAETRLEDRAHRDGSDYRYEYYVCSMRMAPLPDAARHRCSNERLRSAGVDEAVWTAVRDLLADSEAVAAQLQLWAEHVASGSSDLPQRLAQAEHRMRELSRQQDRLLDAYQLGLLPLETFRARMQALAESRLAAEVTLAQVQAEQISAEVARSRAVGAEDVLQRLRPSLLTAVFPTRQTILRLLVERVVVHGQRLEVQLAVPVSGNFSLTSGDQHPRHPAQRCEAVYQATHQRLLAHVRRPARPDPARVLEPTGQEVARARGALGERQAPHLAPVDLQILARQALKANRYVLHRLVVGLRPPQPPHHLAKLAATAGIGVLAIAAHQLEHPHHRQRLHQPPLNPGPIHIHL
jgi:site-specific DNA recombinase